MRTVQRRAVWRSRRELSNKNLLAKFGFDTAENALSKVCQRKWRYGCTGVPRGLSLVSDVGPGARTKPKQAKAPEDIWVSASTPTPNLNFVGQHQHEMIISFITQSRAPLEAYHRKTNCSLIYSMTRGALAHFMFLTWALSTWQYGFNRHDCQKIRVPDSRAERN